MRWLDKGWDRVLFATWIGLCTGNNTTNSAMSITGIW
jgi:hypothetical protein